MNLKLTRYTIFPITFLLLGSNFFSKPVRGENVCRITGVQTAINVRESPNGRIIGTLQNGHRVYVGRTKWDGLNVMTWDQISGYYRGHKKTFGWVDGDYVSCGSGSSQDSGGLRPNRGDGTVGGGCVYFPSTGASVCN